MLGELRELEAILRAASAPGPARFAVTANARRGGTEAGAGAAAADAGEHKE